jgi:uncharacterized membrane protein
VHLRLIQLWEDIRASYWFIPLLMAVGAVLLAVVTIYTDRFYGDEIITVFPWIFSGGADGARAVLSTVAGSMITVAGTTFSVTIVALVLASGQFGPRLLRNFMRDTANQVVLGTFIATFVYCLLILRNIRSVEEGATFVPYLAVSVGVGLGLASIGVLIFFIHHVSVSIQAPQVIARAANELHSAIDRLFPESAGSGPAEERRRPLDESVPESFENEARTVLGDANGYVEAIDLDRLMDLAGEEDLLLRLEVRPGHFSMRDGALMRVFPGARLDDALGDKLRRTIALGVHRTATQDVGFPLEQLVEVAVRALSPGINDPFTAVTCIDHLGAGLCHLLQREMPSSHRFDDEGRLRLIVHDGLTFSGMADAAFNQIRQNASYQVAIYLRLLETIADVLRCTTDEERQAPLLRHAEMIQRAACENTPEAQDRVDVAQRYEAVQRAAGERRAALARRENET